MGFIPSATAKFFVELLEHESVKVMSRVVERGTIKKKKKIPISFVPPSKDDKILMKAKECSVAVNDFEGTYPQQATTDDRATILLLALFDNMLKSSKLVEHIESDQRALKLNKIGGLSDRRRKS